MRQVIEEIETRSPVELIAIGIGHDVTRYYRRAVTITDPSELAGAMTDKLVELFEEDARRRQLHRTRAAGGACIERAEVPRSTSRPASAVSDGWRIVLAARRRHRVRRAESRRPALETGPIAVDAPSPSTSIATIRERKAVRQADLARRLVLTSPVAAIFGGWSGLALDPDGKGFFAVSDAGTWIRAL